MPVPWRSLFWPTVATLVALTILIGLGTWQTQRLQWKLGLIHRIETLVHAAPVPVEDVLTRAADPGQEIEYLHVKATGRFQHGFERYLYASGEGEWGWDVITPFALASGQVILVNRGFVPNRLLDRASRASGLPAGAIELTGLVRRPRGDRPWSVPSADIAKRQWYWPEIASIAASLPADAPRPITTLYIDSDPIHVQDPPAGGATNLDLPNRHLEYVLTWYGLAGALAVIYALFAYQRLTIKRG